MVTSYQTLAPEMPVSEAVKIFTSASEKTGRTVFGLMVMDDGGQLIGILSMYDIMVAIQPKHIHIWGEMKDIATDGLIEMACERSRSLLVSDIMATDVITIDIDAHLLMALELMNKKHVRRLPVSEEGEIVGMVYISDVFHQLLDRLHDQE
jgi:CBS domain-containing protein